MASMELGITVPTNPADLNKTLELTVDPSKNITVKGSCPKNATKEVKRGFRFSGLDLETFKRQLFLDADSIMGRH